MRRRGPRERSRLAGGSDDPPLVGGLGYEPLPSLRTIESGCSKAIAPRPRFGLEPCARPSSYPY